MVTVCCASNVDEPNTTRCESGSTATSDFPPESATDLPSTETAPDAFGSVNVKTTGVITTRQLGKSSRRGETERSTSIWTCLLPFEVETVTATAARDESRFVVRVI